MFFLRFFYGLHTDSDFRPYCIIVLFAASKAAQSGGEQGPHRDPLKPAGTYDTYFVALVPLRASRSESVSR